MTHPDNTADLRAGPIQASGGDAVRERVPLQQRLQPGDGVPRRKVPRPLPGVRRVRHQRSLPGRQPRSHVQVGMALDSGLGDHSKMMFAWGGVPKRQA